MSETSMDERAVALYVEGSSLPEVEAETGIPRSTIRRRLLKMGLLRGRTAGVRLAAEKGRLGGGLRGKARVFSDAHKRAISQSRLEWGEKNARGFRINSSGYIEYTRGEHKGRHEHAVIMEQRLGRRLRNDECVHHIDGDKTNNSEDNLALVTRAGHTRLHRREDQLAGTQRRRKANGTWC